MTPSPSQKDRERVRALAKLFDAVGPSTRAEAEDELRTAGIDPDDVGARTRNLATAMLANGAASDRAPAAPRRWFTSNRLAWSAAAALLLCLAGWGLTREAQEPGSLLRHYRERLQRGSTERDGQRVAGGLPRTDGHSPVENPTEAEASAPTPAPAATPIAEANAEAGAPLHEFVVDTIEGPWSPGGVIMLAGEIPAATVVDRNNLEAYQAALTPGLQWAVRQGLRIRMVEPRRVYLPGPYREATELNSGAVRLGPGGASLENYVAGQPFPAIDVTDRQAAAKIMWNYEYRPFATDDLEARDFELEAGVLGENGARIGIERRIVFEAFRRLYYNGRLYTDPRPERPNPDGIRFRESLHPVREPTDLRGVGQTMIRSIDARKLDASWLYLPSLNRVRRLGAAQRSDALFGQDADMDSTFGFSGSLGSMTWRLIAEGEVPGCMHAENHRVQWGEGSADFMFDDVWEMRPVYVIEGTSRLPNYAYGKRVLYIDREAWVVLMSDIYDRRGELWKVWLGMFSADETGGTLDHPAAVMIDVQRRHVTRIAVPNPRSPTTTGWIVNQGETGGITEDWFRIAHLIDSGR